MVIKVLSEYDKNPPLEGMRAHDDRIIGTERLYPNILATLINSTVKPVTNRTIDMMSIHKIDIGNVRTWINAAVSHGKYINSQWCTGNSPAYLFACDSYVVSGLLYCPKVKEEILTDVYIKFCILKTGATVTVLSLHPSNQDLRN